MSIIFNFGAFMKISWKSILVFLFFGLSLYGKGGTHSNDFVLRIGKWQKSEDGNFRLVDLKIDDEIITLFDGSLLVREFEGFTLRLTSSLGFQKSRLTVEYILSKEEHPLNDKRFGIGRNKFEIANPGLNHFESLDTFINVDYETKYCISLWDFDM